PVPGVQHPKDLIDILRRKLKATLPHFMVPHEFVIIATLPMLSNGKIDKKKLQEFSAVAHATLSEVQSKKSPRNQIEFELMKLWQEILGKKEIGMCDDFFALGGNSLKA